MGKILRLQSSRLDKNHNHKQKIEFGDKFSDSLLGSFHFTFLFMYFVFFFSLFWLLLYMHFISMIEHIICF